LETEDVATEDAGAHGTAPADVADEHGLTPFRAVLVGLGAGALFYVAYIPLQGMLAHLVTADSPNLGTLGLRVVAYSALCFSPLVAVAAAGMAHHGRSLRSLSDTAWRAGRTSGLVFVTCIGWLGGMYVGAVAAGLMGRYVPGVGVDYVLTPVMCFGAVSAFAALLSVARGTERAAHARAEHGRA